MRVKHKGEAGRDSKYWIMGGWKSLSINGWVGHNGGVDLKMGLIHSKVILVPQKIQRYLTKLPPFDPMPQEYSASVFQNWHRIHILLHFHACSFSNNRYV